MAYKQKTKQYIINSAKQPAYFIQDDFIILNLNANFPKKDNTLNCFLNKENLSLYWANKPT